MAIKSYTVKVPYDDNSGYIPITVFLTDAELPSTTTLPNVTNGTRQQAETLISGLGLPISETMGPVIQPCLDTGGMTDAYSMRNEFFPYIYDNIKYGKEITLNGTKYRVSQIPVGEPASYYRTRIEWYDSVNEVWSTLAGAGASASGASDGKTVDFGSFIYQITSFAAWDTDRETAFTGKMGNIEFKYWIASNQEKFSINVTRTFSVPSVQSNLAFNNGIVRAESIDPTDPYALNPNSIEGGGNGNYDNSSDIITDSYNTNLSTGGFVSLYTPSTAQLLSLANYMWDNSFQDVIKSTWDKIGSLGLAMTDYIISLHKLPVTITPGTSKNVELGWYPTTVSMDTLTSFGQEIDMGSITIEPYWGNALDYKSRIQIYLPYVGFEDLDTQGVMGKTVSLKYIVEYISGDCQAQIYVNGSLQYQFKGNMAYHIPVGQSNFSDIVQEGIAIGAGMIVGGAAGAAASNLSAQAKSAPRGPKGGITKQGRQLYKEARQFKSLSSDAYDFIGDVATSHQASDYSINIGGDVTRGGALGGNSGWFACQTPYIIINRPRLSLPSNYGHYHGYPSNITSNLGSLRGYTKVRDIHLENIGCTGAEEIKLDGLLKDGVIIRNYNVTTPSVFTLYTNNSDMNTIGKSLTSLTTCSDIKLKDETNMFNPSFLLTDIDSSINKINYLYYPDFGRWYFVKGISSIRNGLWQLDCDVDVLETYASQIALQTGVIDRQEYNFNLLLDDGTLASYANGQVIQKAFPYSFNSKGVSNVLVILGS